MTIDPLLSSASELQSELTRQVIKSTDLIDIYLDQIEQHNHRGMALNAIISVAPRDVLLAEAKKLDIEREERGPRGPLHGIPIIVKDSICTGPELGMETTAGTFALRMASRNAAVIDKVIAAGMIVIAKANLSELSGHKDYNITTGWSAKGGLTQSPYIRGGVASDHPCMGHTTACGSSSGSASVVAAGFAPLSLGTETNGSLVQPACRAGLYALKPTVGSVPADGVLPVGPSFESVGGIAKTVRDLADITAVLQDQPSYSLSSSWEGIGIGFVDPELWQASPFMVEPREDFKIQTFAAMDAAMRKIEKLGGRVQRDVPLVRLTELESLGGVSIGDLFAFEYSAALEHFLGSLHDTSARTLQELIDFNLEHAELELPAQFPGQKTLIAVLENNMTEAEFLERSSKMRTRAWANIEDILTSYGVDVILAPGDAQMTSIASIAGYPHGAVPLGLADFNGRPFGMNVLARAGEEAKILNFMSAWEASFPDARIAPPLLVKWHEPGLDEK